MTKSKIPELLNNNLEAVIGNLKQESIDTFLFLKNQFLETKNITENYLFHFVFRSFYRLDNAGLSNEMKVKYFEIMQDIRYSPKIDLASICNELYKLENLKGQNTLQFSFSTKMANIIDEKFPIYDSEVAAMFNFRAPYNYKSYDERIKCYCDFYHDLEKNYSILLENNLVLHAINEFECKFSNTQNLSDIKKLDFLMWSAGKLKRKNLLILQ